MSDRPKILIVDDRPENLLVLEKIMADLEVEPVRATSGNQALALTLENEFALALVDVQMPEMDGYEMVSLLRQEEKTAQLPVIFISAVYSGEYYKVKGTEVGAVDFIEKPIPRELLLGKIKVFLKLYEQHRELEQLNQRLEERVAAQTEALSATNRRLCNELEERRKLEQQLRQACKMEAIGTMAGGIAHDFNNILSIIMAYVELALESSRVGQPVDEDLQVVLEAVNRGSELIRQIMTFCRQSERRPQLVDPSRQLNESLRLIRATIPTAVEIGTRVEWDDDELEADPIQFNQIIINLCNNASQAMKQKGRIDISLAKSELGPEQLSDEMSAGQYMVLKVRDTGPGIDPKILDLVFDPFFTTKDIDQGTGMGLSVVQGIARQHGGRVEVANAMGGGAEFTVYLPLELEEGDSLSPETRTEFRQRRPDHHDIKVMVIDDEQQLVRVLERLLSREGYQVRSFTGAQEALEAFKADPAAFDLVLTDMNMPKMSGPELAREMLAVKPDQLLVLTSGINRLLEVEADTSIFQACLQKPFTRDSVVELIEAVVPGADV